MKKIVFLIICVSLIRLSSAQTATNALLVKGPEGIWKCLAPDAPYQYQTFNLLLQKAGDQFNGKIVEEGNIEIPLNSISFKDSAFEISLNVESSLVTLKMKWDGTKLKGVAITEQGEIAITGERIEIPEKKIVTTDTLPTVKTDTVSAAKK